MRPGFSFNHSTSPPPPFAAADTISPASNTAPWRSPVPYLFGGLAAMLGLITFALLVLACSYWKLSGYLERADGAEHMSETVDSGGRPKAAEEAGEKPPTALEERFVVVMAGDDEKIFLANPIRSRAYEESLADEKVDSECRDAMVNVTCGDSTPNLV